MKNNRIFAMVTVAALAGLVHTLGPANTTDVSQNNNTPVQNATEQKPATTSSTTIAATPEQTSAPSSDSLLSEMKVYPSF